MGTGGSACERKKRNEKIGAEEEDDLMFYGDGDLDVFINRCCGPEGLISRDDPSLGCGDVRARLGGDDLGKPSALLGEARRSGGRRRLRTLAANCTKG